MSVTVTIKNNREYCLENNLVGAITYPCQRCDYYGLQSDCSECQGKGAVSFEELPFELNMANSNFRTVWYALALDFDYCGEIDPQELLASLETVGAEMFTKAGEADARVISLGIGPVRASQYLVELRKIAQEAHKRGTTVVWG